MMTATRREQVSVDGGVGDALRTYCVLCVG